MKTLLNFCLIFFTITTYCQKYSKTDVVGNWQVNKAELFLDGTLVKTSYIDSESDESEIIVNGQNLGPYNENLDSIVKSFINSHITFDDNNNCSWDINTADLGFKNKYYMISNLSEIEVKDLEDSVGNKQLINFKIERIDVESAIFTSNDSGIGFKLYVNKIE